MPADLDAPFGITPVINAVGYATRVSGSCPHPDVVAAMAAESANYFEIDDLLDAASELIQRCTGAEAGIIAAGAGAALTLGAAACLAGNNVDIMDRLPDTSRCPRDEIIYPAPGPFDYDHAIRLSGAKLITLDYRAPDALAQIERAIHAKTAAIGVVWYGVDEKPNLDDLVALAHRHQLPVILDGAFAMPPVENLTAFSRRGVDLIAYSGGKHLGGPQASGILCGRADLIRSAWLQMVDMDVRAGTWSRQQWIDAGLISRPPRHGVGRSMKVSKEAMFGLMTALDRYAKRDHAAEYETWKRAIDTIYDGLKDVAALRVTKFAQAFNGQPYPLLQIESGVPPQGMRVRDLILALRALPGKIVFAEDEVSPDKAYVFAQCLRPGDAETIVSAVRAAVQPS
jgi:D-glucosaminate-6-phosphate ammonia-lyase